MEQAADALQAECAELQAELTALEEEPPRIPALRSRKADLEEDSEKLQQIMQQLQTLHDVVTQKVTEKRRDLAAAEDMASRAEQTVSTLRAQVGTQELSAADVESLRSEKAALQARIQASATAHDKAMAEKRELDLQVSQSASQLAAEVEQYHDTLQRAGVSLHQAGPGAQAQLKLDTAAIAAEASCTSNDILGTDIDGAVMPALRELRASTLQALGQARERQARAMEDADAAHEKVEEVQGRIADAQRRKSMVEAELAREKDAAQDTLSRGNDEMSELEALIRDARAYRDNMTELAREVDDEALARQQRQVEKEARAAARERAAAVAMYVDACTAVVNHKAAISEKLEAIHGTAASALAASETLPPALAAAVQRAGLAGTPARDARPPVAPGYADSTLARAGGMPAPVIHASA